MIPGITIRPATAFDGDKLRSAWEAMLTEQNRVTHQEMDVRKLSMWQWVFKWMPAIYAGGSAIFLAIDESSGSVVGGLWWISEDGQTAKDNGTWVSPEHRKRGISTSFRVAAKEACKKAGVKRVLAFIPMADAVAIDHAVKSGFEQSAVMLEMKL